MFVILKVVMTTLQAIGEACARKKPLTPAPIEQQRIHKRNQRIIWTCIVLVTVLLAILILVDW
jgi:hypothetical protein